jgi:hypothetical protein
MARSEIEALFTAKESVSEALDRIERATDDAGEGMTQLTAHMANLSAQGHMSEEASEDLKETLSLLSLSADMAEDSVEDINRALKLYGKGAMDAEDATHKISVALRNLENSSAAVDRTAGQLSDELQELSASEEITQEAADRLESSIESIGFSSSFVVPEVDALRFALSSKNRVINEVEESTVDYSQSLQQLNASALSAVIPQNQLEESVEDAEDEMSKASRQAIKTAGSLGILSAVAESTSLSFGSLSVNIGPFNFALRNILTQLPAIITGMGTTLALVVALGSAFAVLAGTVGALVAGGGLLFFENFSQQFEDTAEATEALMGALRDLFTEAMEPLMTEANMDLFIDVINGAAVVVNRFAQFFNQMRGDVLSFFDGMAVDAEAFFETLHDSFVILQPVLESFVEFFVSGFPKALMMFTLLTERVEDKIGGMASSFGKLFVQLMEFGATVINGVAPVVSALVDTMSALFYIINLIPHGILRNIVFFGALTALIAKVTLSIWGLVSAIAGAHTWMTTMAFTASGLTGVIGTLYGATYLLITGQINLATATSMVQMRLALYNSTVATAVTRVAAFITTLWSSVTALASNAAFTVMSTIATKGYTGALLAATAAVWGLIKSLLVLAAPLLLKAAIIGAIVAAVALLIDYFIGWGKAVSWLTKQLSPLISLLEDVWNWLTDIAAGFGGFIDKLLGGGTNMAKAKKEFEALRTDDIQTENQVDLSFEESLEQNVDVTADPEDREGLRRIVKDAMNEANSIARRQEGLGR